jgi:hypothetical protein
MFDVKEASTVSGIGRVFLCSLHASALPADTTAQFNAEAWRAQRRTKCDSFLLASALNFVGRTQAVVEGFLE